MAQYGLEYRGRHITIIDSAHSANGGVACVVKIGDVVHDSIRGIPFQSVHLAQTTGAAFARALIDAQLDGDSFEHRGYFIRATSTEQRDGSWSGGYQLHRNDNPMPFRRVACEPFRSNTALEAEENAVKVARVAIDADIAAGKL